MKLNGKSFDITDYVFNSNIEKIAEFADNLTPSAKTAHVPSYEELSELKTNDFAVSLYDKNKWVMNKYAMHSADMIELNIQLLANTKDSIPVEILKTAAMNLTAAAQAHDITIPQELSEYISSRYVDRKVDISKIAESVEKVASAVKEDVYAIGNKYPITTQQHLSKAASWFDNNKNKLTASEITEFAKNFIKQAGALNFDYKNSSLSKYANFTPTEFNSDYKFHILNRRRFITDGDSDTLNMLNDIVKRADEFGVEKTAALVELLDQDLGISRLYGQKLLHPIEAIYGTVKEASVKAGSHEITLGMLSKMSASDLSEFVGTDGAQELQSENGLEVFDSLPMPIKEAILSKVKE